MVGALVLAPSLAQAEPATLSDGAYFALTAENADADLELGISLGKQAAADKPTLRVRPFLRVPLSNTDDNIVRIDGHADTAKVGVGIDCGIDFTAATGPARFIVASAQGELGTALYSFTPMSNPTGEQERHHSFSTRASFRYGHLAKAFQVAPQLSVAYDRNYTAADAIGIVVPGSDGSPDTVQSTVVSPPSVTPAITARVGSPLFIGAIGAPIGFGGYLVATTSGAAGDFEPTGEGRVVRGELWTYLFVNEPANARAGLALFAESARGSADSDAEMGYGLFVQLKLNTTLFEY